MVRLNFQNHPGSQANQSAFVDKSRNTVTYYVTSSSNHTTAVLFDGKNVSVPVAGCQWGLSNKATTGEGLCQVWSLKKGKKLWLFRWTSHASSPHKSHLVVLARRSGSQTAMLVSSRKAGPKSSCTLKITKIFRVEAFQSLKEAVTLES